MFLRYRYWHGDKILNLKYARKCFLFYFILVFAKQPGKFIQLHLIHLIRLIWTRSIFQFEYKIRERNYIHPYKYNWWNQVHKKLDSGTSFLILPLYTTTVDLKWSSQYVIEVQTYSFNLRDLIKNCINCLGITDTFSHKPSVFTGG